MAVSERCDGEGVRELNQVSPKSGIVRIFPVVTPGVTV